MVQNVSKSATRIRRFRNRAKDASAFGDLRNCPFCDGNSRAHVVAILRGFNLRVAKVVIWVLLIMQPFFNVNMLPLMTEQWWNPAPSAILDKTWQNNVWTTKFKWYSSKQISRSFSGLLICSTSKLLEGHNGRRWILWSHSPFPLTILMLRSLSNKCDDWFPTLTGFGKVPKHWWLQYFCCTWYTFKKKQQVPSSKPT